MTVPALEPFSSTHRMCKGSGSVSIRWTLLSIEKSETGEAKCHSVNTAGGNPGTPGSMVLGVQVVYELCGMM